MKTTKLVVYMIFSFLLLSQSIKAQINAEEILRPKLCFAKANLVFDKFKCSTDAFVVQSHFDINKSVTIIDSITMIKVIKSKKLNINN